MKSNILVIIGTCSINYDGVIIWADKNDSPETLIALLKNASTVLICDDAGEVHRAIAKGCDAKTLFEVEKPLEWILSEISKKLGVSVGEMRSRDRSIHLVNARYAFFWKAKKYGYTLMQMAKMVERDHSLAVHGLKECRNKYNYKLQKAMEKCFDV